MPPQRYKTLIAPSLLAANAARLGDEAQAVAAAGADWLHLDIMDGHFVPNLSFGPATAAALQGILPLDLHLMVAQPLAQIGAFAAAADSITIHFEAESTAQTLAYIKDCGCKAGLALKPDTPLETIVPYIDAIDLLLVMTVEPGAGGQGFLASQLPKLAAARRLLDDSGRVIRLQADGGIDAATAADVRAAGADVLVAGTAIFKSGSYAAAIAGLRDAAA